MTCPSSKEDNLFKVTSVPDAETFLRLIDQHKNNQKALESCNKELWKLFKCLKQRLNEVALKKRMHRTLEKSLAEIFPENKLYLKGSTVNNLGSHNSDLDLTLVMPSSLSTSCNDILAFETLISAKNYLLQQPYICDVELVDARVPIIQLKMNFPYNQLAVDISCNCVSGIYNSHLLRHFAQLDERFVAMVVVVKKHCSNNGVLDSTNGRLNSYAITLMIVHFLQCAVRPPILPNLMAMFPSIFDGKSTALKDLKHDWILPVPVSKNRRTLAELVLGFYNYYAEFDYANDGISILEARVFSKKEERRCERDYAFYLEDPYEHDSVARNMKKHMLAELKQIFKEASDVLFEDVTGNVC